MIVVELHNEEDKLFFTLPFLTHLLSQQAGELGIQFFESVVFGGSRLVFAKFEI